MRIAVCDDNVKEQEQVICALQESDATRTAECFANGSELLSAAANEPPFDLVFLDIYMVDENGLKVAESLHELSPSTGIVFVTSSMDHAIEAFSLEAIHYLVKPITAEGVEEAIRRVMEMKQKKRRTIVFSLNNSTYTVFSDEINFVQSVGHFKEVVLINGRTFQLRISMEELLSKLGNTFLKINRSIIVNMEQIEQMDGNRCMLKDGTQLEFSRRERTAIRTAYNNYLFDCLSERRRKRE